MDKMKIRGKLEETLDTYNKDVERYVQKLEFPLPKTELDMFIEMLSGKRVLDAGCGAGRDSAYLSEQGLEVIGIDMSEGMLEAAKQRAKADFRYMDVRETKFQKNYFHGIWCYNTFLHLMMWMY